MTRPAAFSERIASPDGRYYLLTAMNEVRVSHWIRSASLWDALDNDVILSIGDSLWSSDEIAWSADGLKAFISIQKYPGDSPPAEIELLPDESRAVLRTPEGEKNVTFEELSSELEAFYERTRYAEPQSEEPPLFVSGALVATTVAALVLWVAGIRNPLVTFGLALLLGVPGGYLLERYLRV